MKEIYNSSESKNPLKSEHLKDAADAIIACVGTREQFERGAGFEIYKNMAPNQSKNSNVDYFGKPEELAKKNFKNAGEGTYVISPVDNADKFSRGFANCTGVIVAGRDKETGENVSFVSHQDSDYFLYEKNADILIEDLKSRLEELRKKSADGTIDAVVVGGNYFENSRGFQQGYLDSIKLLSAEIKKILGFEPVIMTGPKTVSKKDDIFYDNKHRRLYIIRPEVGNASAESFVQSNIKNQRKKWKGKL